MRISSRYRHFSHSIPRMKSEVAYNTESLVGVAKLTKDSTLITSNGHWLAEIPVVLDESERHLTPRWISAKQLQTASTGIHDGFGDFVLDIPQAVDDGVARPLVDGDPERWTDPEDTGVVVVGINANYLARIAEAIGAEDGQVYLMIDTHPEARERPVTIYGYFSDGRALLMPLVGRHPKPETYVAPPAD